LTFKGLVQIEINVSVYDFLFSAKHNQSYNKNILALPSFIVGVNGTLHFETQKSIHIRHKSDPYGSNGLIETIYDGLMLFFCFLSVHLSIQLDI